MNDYKKIVRCLFISLVCSAVKAQSQTLQTFMIVNPINQPRRDELVIVKRKDIEKKTGVLAEGKYVTITATNNISVDVQHDDVNGDGKWDEVVFLYNFTPNEKAVFQLAVAHMNSHTPPVMRAHVRLKKKGADDAFGPSLPKEEMPLRNPATDFSRQPLPLYLTEGPGWENDKVAFRLYFDVRNGKDIFAKRTARMVLDSVGVRVHPSYHELQDWGMDVLHAGQSLGSGGLALWVPLKGGKDTLIRLGGEHIKRTVYQQIADGPIRAMFRISYDWTLDGRPVHIEEQTSIWGGQYFYESQVLVKGAPAGSKLVNGMANFYDNVFGSFSATAAQVFFTHGRQSENKDYLGMAILVPQQDFAFAGSTPNTGSDILNTYIVAQNIHPGKWCTYRFYAGWEKTDPAFASKNYFKEYLEKEMKKVGRSIVLMW